MTTKAQSTPKIDEKTAAMPKTEETKKRPAETPDRVSKKPRPAGGLSSASKEVDPNSNYIRTYTTTEVDRRDKVPSPLVVAYLQPRLTLSRCDRMGTVNRTATIIRSFWIASSFVKTLLGPLSVLR